jgi:hypothetical protein
MTVTPPASMSKVRGEYGGDGRMSQYRRAGGIVPDHANTAPISTSLPRMSQFNNTSKDPPAPSLGVNLQSDFSNDSRPDGSNIRAWAGWSFNPNGTAYRSNSQYGDRAAYTWLTAGNAQDVQFYCTVDSQEGASVAGQINQWVGPNAAWWNISTTNLTKSVNAQLTVQARVASTGQGLGLCTISLYATEGEPI